MRNGPNLASPKIALRNWREAGNQRRKGDPSRSIRRVAFGLYRIRRGSGGGAGQRDAKLVVGVADVRHLCPDAPVQHAQMG